MAQSTARRKVSLGPGFWPVTIGLTIVNIVITYIIAVFPFQNYVPELGAPAGDIDTLFRFMSVFGNAIFVYVIGYLVYFSIVWRQRRSDGPDAIGVQIHDVPKLEFWWTVIPSLIILTIAIFSVRIWASMQNTPGDVLTMEAIGHQFRFEFRYPKLKQSVYDSMHVPVDTPVTLHVTSADVIHSFWSPALRIKADMVPGLVQTLRFTPEHIGKYRIICTEFCGTQHANMAAAFYVDSQQGFGRWLSAQAKQQGQPSGSIALASGQTAAGQALFGQKCSTCHSTGPFSQRIVGPGLGHLFNDPAHPDLVTGEKASPAAISHILINGYSGPIGTMPNRQANSLTNQDIANLVAYLTSLSQKR
ncbi:MAG: cytochrome c oxidase subunit II [Candidatus Eremiobacteraeota bacterium]|nr:cytochrome c oxidase subunit II [Candidatus Eremiobacteraeota bacterium]